MASTTAVNIKLIAPHTVDLSDDLFDLIIADVGRSVTAATFGTKQEEAQRYLAAHLLTLVINEGAGNVTEEKVGQVRFKYSEDFRFQWMNRRDETSYGRRFNDLVRMCSLNFQVIAPVGT